MPPKRRKSEQKSGSKEDSICNESNKSNTDSAVRRSSRRRSSIIPSELLNADIYLPQPIITPVGSKRPLKSSSFEDDLSKELNDMTEKPVLITKNNTPTPPPKKQPKRRSIAPAAAPVIIDINEPENNELVDQLLEQVSQLNSKVESLEKSAKNYKAKYSKSLESIKLQKNKLKSLQEDKKTLEKKVKNFESIHKPLGAKKSSESEKIPSVPQLKVEKASSEIGLTEKSSKTDLFHAKNFITKLEADKKWLEDSLTKQSVKYKELQMIREREASLYKLLQSEMEKASKLNEKLKSDIKNLNENKQKREKASETTKKLQLENSKLIKTKDDLEKDILKQKETILTLTHDLEAEQTAKKNLATEFNTVSQELELLKSTHENLVRTTEATDKGGFEAALEEKKKLIEELTKDLSAADLRNKELQLCLQEQSEHKSSLQNDLEKLQQEKESLSMKHGKFQDTHKKLQKENDELKKRNREKGNSSGSEKESDAYEGDFFVKLRTSLKIALIIFNLV